MSERGRILRDTNAGPGLLTVEGKQYTFALEKMWLSEVPPKAGMLVDVTFNTANAVDSVQSVPENQIAREQAGQAVRQGGAIARRIKAKFGLPTIVAFGILLLGWFFLSSVVVGRGTIGIEITFWRLLGFVGKAQAFSGLDFATLTSASTGIYGLLAILCLAGPFLAFIWKDRRATLGGLMPLLFMLLVAVLLWSNLHHAAQQAREALGDLAGTTAAAQKMADDAMTALMQQFQIGMGVYVSFAASCYFAFVGVKKYLVANA